MKLRRPPAERVASLYRLRHDPITDRVELHVGTLAHDPCLWVARRDLRAFTDHLHDFADDLDWKDRNA